MPEPTEIKSENITIRLNSDLLQLLRSYAKTKNASLNSTITSLLIHSINWDVPAARAGWVPLPKRILMAIIDEFDEKTIQKLAEHVGRTIPREVSITMRGKISVKEWVSILKDRANASGFSYQEQEEGNAIKFITKHDMGMKWSLWFKTFYGTYFSEIGCKPRFTITDNTIVYEIDKKDIH